VKGRCIAEIIVSYEESPLVEVVRKFAPGKVSIVMVLDSNLNIIGLITEAAVFEGMARYGPRAPYSSDSKMRHRVFMAEMREV